LNAQATAIAAFLDAAGWAGAASEPVSADWSTRRYLRLRKGGRSVVLMDSRADPSVGRFVAIGRWLRGLGLHAPEIVVADEMQGLLLLEDLGDRLLARAVEEGADEQHLYDLALEAILTFQRAEPPAFLPPMDDAALIALLDLFLDQRPMPPAAAARDGFRAVWSRLLPLCRRGRPGFLYRDYHAENLMVLGHGRTLWDLGLIDFQDGHVGPPVYDLVSLVQDARRDVPPAVAERVVERFRAVHGLGRDEVEVMLAIMGAQRALRILGVAARLEQSGRRLPAGILPRVRAHLRRNLSHPVMAPLRSWCARHYPDLVGVA
jgi:aminoglycoside/choline kinase family phosphotransferase